MMIFAFGLAMTGQALAQSQTETPAPVEEPAARTLPAEPAEPAPQETPDGVEQEPAAASPETDEEASETGTFSVKSLDLGTALIAAAKSIETCNADGHPVGVSVVDAFGVEQVTLRSNLGGPHVADTARRKARTAVTFNMNTMELNRIAQQGEPWGLRTVPDVVLLGGGLPIRSANGDLLGGIAVAGGGGGANEEICARAGLDAIAEYLE
ncbi:heme-binding protein [Roseibium sp. RKSG952]|uniref:GlcG/HbpS family heme-binding protein n=1 Tax=Roseibium sp. RKSG952 TaxID=2529384 RepID=UPI001AD8A195|nr:heme-binding protein [Roseibium sp. RKSG952]